MSSTLPAATPSPLLRIGSRPGCVNVVLTESTDTLMLQVETSMMQFPQPEPLTARLIEVDVQ